MHLKHQGKPLAMVLDVVEVVQVGVHNLIHITLRLTTSQSHSGANLAEAFAKILANFGITDKVSTTHHDKYNVCRLQRRNIIIPTPCEATG